MPQHPRFLDVQLLVDKIGAWHLLMRVVCWDIHQMRRAWGRGLDVYEADVAAVAAGYHPLEVWGDLWLYAPEPNDRETW